MLRFHLRNVASIRLTVYLYAPVYRRGKVLRALENV